MIHEQPDFGKIIKEHRVAAGLSQSELAKKIGTSASQISTYENNKCNMSVYRFCCICGILK
jgi:transcriptional regulator with XRE-family HTH domain